VTEGEPISSRLVNRRIAVWAVVTLVLAGALSLLSISTVSYTYSPFMQRTYREVGHHGFVSVWKTQVEDLSSISSQWLLDIVFVAAIAVLLVSVAVGMWLLLVGSGDQTARDRRYHLPGHQTE
jgi:hypothetical protein